MGDLLRVPNNLYVAASDADTPARLPSTTTQSLISPERWAIAEKATRQIISKVLPTDVSGKTRREIIGYIYRLIRGRTGCEVFPYGSVPLKTYLPDGDIDLTVFGGPLSEDLLADDIASLLERDGRNEDTEFIVKDVQLIRAEVKIVKCIVQNVVIDISLNQIGGLCTLCFLEKVDRLIGKEHLFKRSIILIKTWCYYESRILGAPHGLISTYALETLVLYIFNLFHSSLDGPLAVLYKFLDHFSKFDWDNYIITINGPVRLTSLPELRAELPENGGVDLLLNSELIRNCVEMYSVPSRGGDFNSRSFQLKNLNIIDPLKENNNLGRSVSKGNFYRIRSAFAFGARKLGSILTQQEYDLNEELKKFFSNTLERHGCGPRPDVHGSQMLLSETESSTQKFSVPESKSTIYIGTIDACSSTQSESSTDGINAKRASTVNANYCKENGHQYGSDQECRSDSVRLAGNVVNQMRISGDAKDHSTYESKCPKTSINEAKKPNANAFSLGELCAPHLYITKPSASGKSKSGTLDSLHSQKCEKNIGNSCVSDEVNGHVMENYDVDTDKVPSCGGLKDSVSAIKTRPVTLDRFPESSETMSDLLGDYETHVQCLQCARKCFENASGPPIPVASLSPPLPPLFQFNNPWVAVSASPFYPMNLRLVPGMPFSPEDMQKQRGTGTYFPSPVPLNRVGQVFNRPPIAKERYITSTRTPGTGRNGMYIDSNNMADQNTRKQSQSPEMVEQQSRVMTGHPNLNGLTIHSEGSVDSGSKEAAPVVERNRQQQRKDTSFVIPNVSPVAPTGVEDSRRVLKKSSSYHLKDDDDFPPLSS